MMDFKLNPKHSHIQTNDTAAGKSPFLSRFNETLQYSHLTAQAVTHFSLSSKTFSLLIISQT